MKKRNGIGFETYNEKERGTSMVKLEPCVKTQCWRLARCRLGVDPLKLTARERTEWEELFWQIRHAEDITDRSNTKLTNMTRIGDPS